MLTPQAQEVAERLRAYVEEVAGWREEQDPGTPEWHTLCTIADDVDLLLSYLT